MSLSADSNNDLIQIPLPPPRRTLSTRTSPTTTNLGNIATHDSLGGIVQERTPILPQIQQSWGQIFREFNRGITDGINLLSSNGASPHLATQLQEQCNCLRERLEEIAQEHIQRTREEQEEAGVRASILTSGATIGGLKNLIASLGNVISSLTYNSTRVWASGALNEATQNLGRMLQDLARYDRGRAEEVKLIVSQIGATVQQINSGHNGPPSHEHETDNDFGEFEHFEHNHENVTHEVHNENPSGETEVDYEDFFNCLFEDDPYGTHEGYWDTDSVDHKVIEQAVVQNVSGVIDTAHRMSTDVAIVSNQTEIRETDERTTAKKNEELRLAAIRIANEARNVRTIVSRPLGSA